MTLVTNMSRSIIGIILANAIMATNNKKPRRNPKILKFQNTDHFKIGFYD